jgi:UDPglucose 6-dehydrogenase
MRESSSLVVIPYLQKKGAIINYYDPSGKKKEFSNLKNVFFCKSIETVSLKADLIIIHTDWDEFKYIDFWKLSKNKILKIYDMRNLYSPKKMKKLGFNYFSIGR